MDLFPNCYMFNTHGRCFYGLLCRYGQSHIDPVTGHNVIKPTWNYVESLNKYPPLMKHLLRRKKYDYTFADRLVKTANREITKANVAKRNAEEVKSNGDQKDPGGNEDRSLVDIYYSNLPNNQEEVCRKRSNAWINFKKSCGERFFSCSSNFFSNLDRIRSYSFVHG